MRTLLALLAAATALGLLAAEAAMQPTAADRVRMLTVFGGTAAVAAFVGWWLLGRVGHRTLRSTLSLLAVAAVAVAASTVAVSALTMFLSVHDLRLVLVALGLGVLLAMALTSIVVRRLTSDLTTLAAVAHRIGDGDLAARTGIARGDEIGVVAEAVDRMAAGLAQADRQRDRDEESRRELLTGVSHDLRTPLTSARIALEAVRDGLADDDDRYLRSAIRDLELAGRLVDDLFLLAQLRSGQLRLERLPVDLGDIADGVVEELGPLAAARQVRLAVDAPASRMVEVDPHAIGRVIRNLLDNAIRHAPERSTVTVHVGGDPQKVEVTVRDEGPGLDLAQLDRLGGGPVERRGSAGLGLAIAGGLVRAHGGEFEAAAGPGGQVGFRLPRAGT